MTIAIHCPTGLPRHVEAWCKREDKF